MNCSTQCANCGTCLVPGFSGDAEQECPRCGAQYGGGS